MTAISNILTSNYEQVDFGRRISGAFVIFSQTILIYAFAATTEKVMASSRRMGNFLTSKGHVARDQISFHFEKLYENLSFSSTIVFNYEFLFQMFTSIFSYLSIMLQFELESSNVNHFNLFFF